MNPTRPEPTRTAASAPERNFGLDVARAGAIGLVLVDHLAIYVWQPAPSAQRWFFPLGFLGVELFFVLSGFLIGQILLSMAAAAGQMSLRLALDFWLRRWIRTLPNYYLFLAFLALSPNASPSWEYLVFAQNLCGPTPDFFPISWSLAVEEWFYLLLPLLALALSFFTPSPVRAIMLAALVLFATSVSLRTFLGPGLKWEEEVRRVVMFRFDALMLGVLLAAIFLHRRRWFDRLRSTWTLLTSVLSLAIVYLITMTQYQGWDFVSSSANLLLMPWADLSFALLVGWLWHWKPSAFPLRGAVVCTSLWAYSLYLSHGPVLRALLKTPLRPNTPADVLRWPKLLLFAAACFITAALLYRFFEKPIMDLRRKLPPLPRQPASARSL